MLLSSSGSRYGPKVAVNMLGGCLAFVSWLVLRRGRHTEAVRGSKLLNLAFCEMPEDPVLKPEPY
jgi:hypothetical protein